MAIQLSPVPRRSWKAQALAACVVAEERGALHFGGFEVFAQIGGRPLLLTHGDHGTSAVSLGVHRAKEWHQVGVRRSSDIHALHRASDRAALQLMQNLCNTT